jgi:hypothetical protein
MTRNDQDGDGGQQRDIAGLPCSSSCSGCKRICGVANAPGNRLEGAISARTLTRRFHEQTGMPPLQWLHIARIRRARQLLETTALSVERIATEAGFGSVAAFRQRFGRVVGTSPRRYRNVFRADFVG